MLCNKGCGSGKNRLLLVPSSEHDNQSGALFSSIQNGPLDVVQWRTPFKAKDESTIANGQSAIVSRLHLAFFLDVINPSIDIGEERIKLHSAKKKKRTQPGHSLIGWFHLRGRSFGPSTRNAPLDVMQMWGEKGKPPMFFGRPPIRKRSSTCFLFHFAFCCCCCCCCCCCRRSRIPFRTGIDAKKKKDRAKPRAQSRLRWKRRKCRRGNVY